MTSRRMKTTPAMACLKTILSIFTCIFMIIGLAFLVAGVLFKVKYLMIDELSSINFSTAPWIMIAVGCFIVIVGLVGCCGTIKGNTCLLRTYGFLLGVIFICELGGAIAGIVFRGKVDSSFGEGIDKAVRNYHNDKDLKSALDQAQNEFHCCGVENYTDWWTINESFKNNTVPKSCCISDATCHNYTTEKTDYVNLTTAGNPGDVIYTTGCHYLINSEMTGNLGIIIGTMFGVAFFQVIGLIVACCLASTINANKYELV